MKTLRSNLIPVVLAVSLVAATAMGATITFDNDGGDNRWDTAANWSSDAVPGTGDVARIIGSHFVLIDDAVVAAVKNFQVGWGPSDGSDPQAGEVRMTGGSLSWTAASRVGQRAPGSLTADGATLNGTQNLFIGDGAGGDASLTMTGGSLTLSHASKRRNLKFGLNARGTGSITGATVSVNGDIYTGEGAESVGSLTLVESTVTLGDDFRTALSGGTGTLNISNSTIAGGSEFRLGSGGGNGTAVITDSTLSFDGAFDVGRGFGSIATFNMTGGTINVGSETTTNAMRFGYQGGNGTGTIRGATLNVKGNLVVGNNVAGDPLIGAQGLLNLIDTIVNVGNPVTNQEFSVGKNRGTGVVEMTGGQVNVLSGDARIGETTFQSVEPFAAYPGNGSLTIRGGGILSVSDANSLQIGINDSTGIVKLIDGIILAGTLEIGQPGSGGILDIWNGSVVLNGDQSALVEQYVNDGLIIPFSNAVPGASIEYSFDGDHTTVTAIPEPGTMALLGCGALALMRKRRRR